MRSKEEEDESQNVCGRDLREDESVVSRYEDSQRYYGSYSHALF